ncbi:MAG: phage head closure protein [Parvibaculum sp.]
MSGVGELRERVTIERATRLADGVGGATSSWSELATVWASVIPLSGREVATGERVEAHQSYTITMRYRDDVTTAMRAIWKGRTLNIRSLADPDSRRRRLVLNVEEGAA